MPGFQEQDGIRVIMEFSQYDEQARKATAHLASALYVAWTSENLELSDYRSAVPVLIDTALTQALMATYKLTHTQARLVRSLLGEYGLDDQLDGTTATGLEGLVELVVTNPSYPY